jgi:hypothetical protein
MSLPNGMCGLSHRYRHDRDWISAAGRWPKYAGSVIGSFAISSKYSGKHGDIAAGVQVVRPKDIKNRHVSRWSDSYAALDFQVQHGVALLLSSCVASHWAVIARMPLLEISTGSAGAGVQCPLFEDLDQVRRISGIRWQQYNDKHTHRLLWHLPLSDCPNSARKLVDPASDSIYPRNTKGRPESALRGLLSETR